MFHVEFRQFPHVARAFNLTREDLQRRILDPWVREGAVTLDERRFVRERGKVRIYEAPELGGDQLGLGRGWANVAKNGEDVTEALVLVAQRQAVRHPVLDELKAEFLTRSAERPLALADAVRVSARVQRGNPPSAALALAEQAVWELLHEGAIDLEHRAQPVERHQWQQLLLDWDVWNAAQATTFAIRRSRSSPDANR